MPNCVAVRWHARRGSDASAAGGGTSELSEWQRSIADEGFSKPRKISGTATGHGHSRKRILRTAKQVWHARRDSNPRPTA